MRGYERQGYKIIQVRKGDNEKTVVRVVYRQFNTNKLFFRYEKLYRQLTYSNGQYLCIVAQPMI